MISTLQKDTILKYMATWKQNYEQSSFKLIFCITLSSSIPVRDDTKHFAGPPVLAKILGN